MKFVFDIWNECNSKLTLHKVNTVQINLTHSKKQIDAIGKKKKGDRDILTMQQPSLI